MGISLGSGLSCRSDYITWEYHWVAGWVAVWLHNMEILLGSGLELQSDYITWEYHWVSGWSCRSDYITWEYHWVAGWSNRQRCRSGGGWGVYIPPNNLTPSPPIITKCIPPNILNLPNLLNGDHLVLRTWPSRPKLLNYQLVLKKWQSRPKKKHHLVPILWKYQLVLKKWQSRPKKNTISSQVLELPTRPKKVTISS